MYDWVTLLHSRHGHTVINELSLNKKLLGF